MYPDKNPYFPFVEPPYCQVCAKENTGVVEKVRLAVNPIRRVVTMLPDCSLRQGAGGTEFAHFGSRTCFLRWFYKRAQAYFGQNPEEHIKTIKKRSMEVKNNDFWEKCVTSENICFFWTFPALQGPGPGPYGPIRAHMGPYGPENSKQIRKEIVFIDAFKVPCTLP